MKTIIAGSRNITNFKLIEKCINSLVKERLIEITEVFSGEARGVDKLGATWGVRYGIPVIPFPAKWKVYGLAAGPIRNREMGDKADALIAFWNGSSSGTKGMIEYAFKKNLLTFVFMYKDSLSKIEKLNNVTYLDWDNYGDESKLLL